jgi:hypothetical protein
MSGPAVEMLRAQDVVDYGTTSKIVRTLADVIEGAP